LTEETLVRDGQQTDQQFFPEARYRARPSLLEVENLSSGERFSGVSFDIRAGEIYGIAGLVGAGRTEILKTIFGALPMTGGRIRVDGKGYIPHSPRRSLRDGMVLTPEDRKAEGLILPFSIRQNIALSTLKALARWGILSSRAIQRLANASIESLRIRATSASQEVRRLSGGNQQKVALARAMTASPRVFCSMSQRVASMWGGQVSTDRPVGGQERPW
jgi:ribose transport system ATP-binding protein/rhamnose transport system ATP-binding protein